MKTGYFSSLAAMLLATTMSIAPASAIDLLGMATINESKAGRVVDVQIGGGSVVKADVLPSSKGGGSSAASATVSTDDGLGVDARVGRGVNASARVGGSDRLVDVNVGVGSAGGNGGSSGGGSGGNDAGGNGNAGGAVPGSAGSSGATAAVNGCVGNDPGEAIELFQRTGFSGWQRASAIEIVQLRLCPDDRREVSKLLSTQRDYGRLQSAVSDDTLISAALSRTSYGADRVLGVDRSGARLTVYVY